MIRSYLDQRLAKNDDGISPVIGTILMVAATVIIGGAVYAAINAYSGRASDNNTDAAFRAQAIDSNGDGSTDRVKVTYLSGPEDAAAKVSVRNDAGGWVNPAGGNATALDPGDSYVYDPSTPGAFYVTASIGDQTFLDQTISVDS